MNTDRILVLGRLDPPAVDAVQAYAVEVANGDIILRNPEPISFRPKPIAEDSRHFVILGAGAAGFSAAQELRDTGFASDINLIRQEDALPVFERRHAWLVPRHAGMRQGLRRDRFPRRYGGIQRPDAHHPWHVGQNGAHRKLGAKGGKAGSACKTAGR
jgi:hypothetical protein